MRHRSVVLALFFSLAAGCGGVIPSERAEPTTSVGVTEVPSIETAVIQTGLSHPWDIAFLPNGEMLITQRIGVVSLRRADGALITLAQPADVVPGTEGGMLGMTIDPKFATNRYVYTCFSSNIGGTPDQRVVRWVLSADGTMLGQRRDIVTGIPYANGGRHSGCRPRFGPDGNLWIGTGDAAIGSIPQNVASLGAKVLRVTRDGAPARGNPVLLGGDPRVYTYGHRNVQGIVFHPRTGAAYAVEQGSAVDDEVNKLFPGANSGWHPVPAYNESVPMTDLTLFPLAMQPVWASGTAHERGTAGATFLTGGEWKAWNGSLVLAQLSGTRLLIMTFDAQGGVRTTVPVFADVGIRLRTPVQGPDGALYVTTDAPDGEGQIWRITPQ